MDLIKSIEISCDGFILDKIDYDSPIMNIWEELCFGYTSNTNTQVIPRNENN